jgi:glutamine synthetase
MQLALQKLRGHGSEMGGFEIEFRLFKPEEMSPPTLLESGKNPVSWIF